MTLFGASMVTLGAPRTGRAGRAEFDVTDYGAIGDGVADDTEAIRAAFADATTDSAIYFPPGVYVILGDIDIPFDLSFLTLIGDGSDLVMIDGSMAEASIVIGSAQIVALESLAIAGVARESGLFGECGLSLSAGASVHVRDCAFLDEALAERATIQGAMVATRSEPRF